MRAHSRSLHAPVLRGRLEARVDTVGAHDVDAGHGEPAVLGIIQQIFERRARHNAGLDGGGQGGCSTERRDAGALPCLRDGGALDRGRAESRRGRARAWVMATCDRELSRCGACVCARAVSSSGALSYALSRAWSANITPFSTSNA